MWLPEEVAQPRPLVDDISRFEDGVDAEDPASGEDADDGEQEQPQQIATSVGEGARAAINLLEEFRGADYVDYKKVEA